MDSTNGEMENIFSLLENISAEAMHFDSIILNNENNIRSIDEKASVTNSIAQKLNTLTRSNAQTAAQINDVVEKFNWHAQKYFANLLKIERILYKAIPHKDCAVLRSQFCQYYICWTIMWFFAPN